MGQMAVREANKTSLRDESKTATNASKVPPTRLLGLGLRAGRLAGSGIAGEGVRRNPLLRRELGFLRSSRNLPTVRGSSTTFRRAEWLFGVQLLQ
jgi:hypothetical protein